MYKNTYTRKTIVQRTKKSISRKQYISSTIDTIEKFPCVDLRVLELYIIASVQDRRIHKRYLRLSTWNIHMGSVVYGLEKWTLYITRYGHVHIAYVCKYTHSRHRRQVALQGRSAMCHAIDIYARVRLRSMGPQARIYIYTKHLYGHARNHPSVTPRI